MPELKTSALRAPSWIPGCRPSGTEPSSSAGPALVRVVHDSAGYGVCAPQEGPLCTLSQTWTPTQRFRRAEIHEPADLVRKQQLATYPRWPGCSPRLSLLPLFHLPLLLRPLQSPGESVDGGMCELRVAEVLSEFRHLTLELPDSRLRLQRLQVNSFRPSDHEWKVKE